MWCNSGLGSDIPTFVYIVMNHLKVLWYIYWIINWNSAHFLCTLFIIRYLKIFLAKVLNLHCHWTGGKADLCHTHSAIWNFSSCPYPIVHSVGIAIYFFYLWIAENNIAFNSIMVLPKGITILMYWVCHSVMSHDQHLCTFNVWVYGQILWQEMISRRWYLCVFYRSTVIYSW